MEKSVILAMVILFIIVGYIAYMVGLQQAKPIEITKPTEAEINATANELIATINDAILIKDKKVDNVVFATYVDHGDYIELIYFSSNGTKIIAFVSSNLTYIYPTIYTIQGFKDNIKQQKDMFKQKQIASLGIVFDGCNDKDILNTAVEVQQAINATVEIPFIYKIYSQNESSDASKCFEGICSDAGLVEAKKALYGRYIINTNHAKWKAFFIEASNCTTSECVDIVADEFLINVTNINPNIMAKDISYSTNLKSWIKIYINGIAYDGIVSANNLKDVICKGFLVVPEGCETILNTTVVNSTC